MALLKTILLTVFAATAVLAQPSPPGAFAAASGGAVASGPGAVSSSTGRATAEGAGSTAISDCASRAVAGLCAPAEAQSICSATALDGGLAIDTQAAEANTAAVNDCLIVCTGTAVSICGINRSAQGYLIIPIDPCNECPVVVRNVRVQGPTSYCRCS